MYSGYGQSANILQVTIHQCKHSLNFFEKFIKAAPAQKKKKIAKNFAELLL
jgi:hypothetical protein